MIFWKVNYYYSQLVSEFKMIPSALKYIFCLKKRAFYVGCTDMGNLGDEAILLSIREMCKKDIFIYPISYRKPSSGKWLRYLFVDPDYIILGGGTIIRKRANESYLRILKQLIKKYPRAKKLVIGPGVANAIFAKKIGFPVDKEGWCEFLRATSFLAVRGKESKAELERWGVESRIYILHDPTIWFVKKEIRKKNNQKRIGLNFADIGDRIFGGDKKKIENFAVNFVKYLLKDDWQVYLYSTTDKDLEYMQEEIGLKKLGNIKVFRNYKNFQKSLSFLESLDVFVGQRLHSVIFSSMVFTPFHALAYEPKTIDFLVTSGFNESYSTNVDVLNVELVWERVKFLYSNLEHEQNILYQKMSQVKNEQKQSLRYLLDEINK